MTEATTPPPPRSVGANDPAEVRRTFDASGSVHVRQVLDSTLLAQVRASAAALFAERETLHRTGLLPAAFSVDYVRRFVHLDHLRLGEDAVRTLFHPLFLTIARGYLGKEPEAAAQSHVRSMLPVRPDTYLPFHQDEMILKRKLLNVWIPLTACGVDAPGIEIVLGSSGEQLPVSPRPQARFAVEHAIIDPDVISGKFGSGALWHPVFAVGDAMLFSGAVAHRTYVTSAMTRERMSVELRLI